MWRSKDSRLLAPKMVYKRLVLSELMNVTVAIILSGQCVHKVIDLYWISEVLPKWCSITESIFHVPLQQSIVTRMAKMNTALATYHLQVHIFC